MKKPTRVALLLLAAVHLLLAADPMITTTSLPQGTVGQPYSFQLQATGGMTPYTWEVRGLPPNLQANSATGQITGTPANVGVSLVHVIVRDAFQVPDGRDYSLTIVGANGPLRITTTSLPSGPPNKPYMTQVLAAGGTPPYYFYFGESGMVPPGLMMSNDGKISGIPTMEGAYDVEVDVYDSMEDFTSRRYTLIIGDPLVFITPPDLPHATAGINYQMMVMAKGGKPPYHFQFADVAPPWLTLMADGSLSGTPPMPAQYMIPIRVVDQNETVTTQTFTLIVDSQPQVLQPSDIELQFTALVGGDPPPAQSVTIVQNSTTGRGYEIALETGTGNAAIRTAAPPWLHVDPANGLIPARFTVSVDQRGLTAGVFPARILISTAGDLTRAPITVAVTLTVQSQPQQLEVIPNPLKFSARLASPGRQEQFLSLRNAGGGDPVSFTAFVTGASPWITLVSPNSGQTVRGAPVLVRVQVDTTGLALGQYRDVIRFAAPGQSIEVPVTVFVSGSGPLLDLSVDGVRFRTRAGNGIATTRTVQIINRGNPASTLPWNAEIIRGGEWLGLQMSPGAVTPGAPGQLTLRLLPSAAALPAGAYYALVRVSSAGTLNSPQYLTVVLEVAPSTAATLLDFDPTGVVFVVPPGLRTPRSATFQISASNMVPVAFQAAASTLEGAGWLSVTPPFGAVSSTQTTEITVSVNAATLDPGIYRGEVDLSRGNAVRSINVTLIVAQGAADAPAVPKNGAAADCVPGRLALTQTGLPNHFSVPAGWPASVILRLNDDCGRAVTGGAVAASFSNGDPPLSLSGDGTGVYSATWQPGTAMEQVNMTVRATSAGLDAASTLLIGEVTANQVPVLARNGTLHNLNPKIGGALSPGVVASVFGSGLAAVAESTGTVPLQTNYKETTVFIGPYEVPLYYVSPTQVNVQLPVELDANQQYSVVVSANGALTVPDLLDVVPVEPGVAVFGDGRLIAQHSDYTLVDDAHPARRGEFLIMYLVGLGDTNPSVASGAPSPSDPLAVPLVQPTLTIDGQAVPTVFVGLTPGGVGLFQINFAVPENARTGVPLDVVVKQGDVAANTATLTVAP